MTVPRGHSAQQHNGGAGIQRLTRLIGETGLMTASEGEWSSQQPSTAFYWNSSLVKNTGKRPAEQEGSGTRLSFTQISKSHWGSSKALSPALSSSVLDRLLTLVCTHSPDFFMKVRLACAEICTPGHMCVLSSNFSLTPFTG